MAERPYEQRMRRAIRKALTEIGRDLVWRLRSVLSIDVERDHGFVWRSEPGEPPRRDSWTLWKSMKYKVAAGASTFEDLTVYTFCPYAKYLEDPNILDRPFFVSTIKAAGNLPFRFKQLVAKYMRESDPTADAPAEGSEALGDDFGH